jgi:hypothetical protein
VRRTRIANWLLGDWGGLLVANARLGLIGKASSGLRVVTPESCVDGPIARRASAARMSRDDGANLLSWSDQETASCRVRYGKKLCMSE